MLLKNKNKNSLITQQTETHIVLALKKTVFTKRLLAAITNLPLFYLKIKKKIKFDIIKYF